MSAKKSSKKPKDGADLKALEKAEKNAKKSGGKPSGKSSGKAGRGAGGYLESTKLPVHSLIFVLPLIIFYEWAVYLINEQRMASGHDAYRISADVFTRDAVGRIFEAFGMTGAANHPLQFGILSGIVVVVVLVAWTLITRKGWEIRWTTLLGMLGESVLFAGVWLALWKGLEYFLNAPTGKMTIEPDTAFPWFYTKTCAKVVESVGAGVYEEFLFRMVLMAAVGLVIMGISGFEWDRCRLIAIFPAALLFGAYHHMGPAGVPFTWEALSYYSISGVAFGFLFLTRGFGIAVGAHAVYDILLVFWPRIVDGWQTMVH
jgi:hypothetical protein